jgi:hypothetical protein
MWALFFLLSNHTFALVVMRWIRVTLGLLSTPSIRESWMPLALPECVLDVGHTWVGKLMYTTNPSLTKNAWH